VIAALVAALNSAGVPAVDGAIVSDASSSEAVVIGWVSAEDGTGVVQGVSTVDGGGPAPAHESYTIRCGILVNDGNASRLPAARDRACQLYGQIGQVLAEDPTLGGLATLVNLSDFSLDQVQDAAGATVTIAFGVAVDAYTRT